MHDRLFPGEIEHVAETCLKAQQFFVNRKAPAIYAVHGMDVPPERLHVERLFVQGNAQFLAAANLREIVADSFRSAQQAVGKGGMSTALSS